MTHHLVDINCEFENPSQPLVIGQPIKGLFRVTPRQDLKYISIRYYVIWRLKNFQGVVEEEDFVHSKKFSSSRVGEWKQVMSDEISPYEYPFQFVLQKPVSYSSRNFSIKWYLRFEIEFTSISEKALERAMSIGLDLQSADFPKSAIEQEFPFVLERGNKYLSVVNEQLDLELSNVNVLYWLFSGLGLLGILWARLAHISTLIFDMVGTFGLALGLYHMLEGLGSVGSLQVNLAPHPYDDRLTNVNVTVGKSWSKIKKIGVYYEVEEQMKSDKNPDVILNSHMRYRSKVENQKNVVAKETKLQVELTPNTLLPSMALGNYVVIWKMYLTIYLKNTDKKTYTFDFDVKL